MLNESENQVASPPVDEGKTLLSLVELLLGLSPVLGPSADLGKTMKIISHVGASNLSIRVEGQCPS
jgi:hypothetical protein